jgi:hypothetical protein
VAVVEERVEVYGRPDAMDVGFGNRKQKGKGKKINN